MTGCKQCIGGDSFVYIVSTTGTISLLKISLSRSEDPETKRNISRTHMYPVPTYTDTLSRILWDFRSP